MYLIYNEEKSVVAERFMITLKQKIYQYMTSIPKNMYINKLAVQLMNTIIHVIAQSR